MFERQPSPPWFDVRALLPEWPGILPVWADRQSATPAYLRELGHTKRFLERWTADARFRAAFAEDADAACTRWGLHADPEAIQQLWDQELAAANDPRSADAPAPVLQHRAFHVEKSLFVDELQNRRCAPDEPDFRRWRERQIRRCSSELGLLKSARTVHAPVCFELAEGCSVGCWFCGVAAPDLGDLFLRTPGNRQVWRDTLEVVGDLLGPAAGHGFLYWASDPFDNPDYEDLLLDFANIFGTWPQTTTALAARQLERAHALVELSHRRGGFGDRFSLLSVRELDRVHERFTPTELVFTELVMQNKQSIEGRKANAGRARLTFARRAARAASTGQVVPEAPADASTIACVSGFLISMVRKTVRLISPCSASERWPLGYIQYEEAAFTDARDLGRVMRRLIADYMTPYVRGRDRLGFRSNLEFRASDAGFELVSPHVEQRFGASRLTRRVGELLEAGGAPAADIADRLQLELGVEPAEVFHTLNQLLEASVLDETLRIPPKLTMRTPGNWVAP